MKNKSLTANIAFNVFRTVFSITASVLTYAYITRIFSVGDIGRLHFSQAVISYFMLTAGLGISAFAVRTGAKIRDDAECLRQFACRMFTLSVISTAVSFILLLLFTTLPSKIEEYRTVILIQSVTVLFSPFAVEWIYTIYENYSYIAVKSIAARLISLIFLFACIKNESDFYLYLLLDSAVTGLGDIFNFFYAKKYLTIKPVRDIQWRVCGRPLMTIFLYNLTATVYVHADTVMLGLMADNTAVALYGVSTKIYFVLKDVFNAAGAVTVPRIAAFWNTDRERVKRLVSETLSFMVIFTIPAAVGIILLRKEIVCLIAGKAYEGSIRPLVFLAPALVFSSLGTVLSKNFLITVGKEKTVAKITLISAVMNVLLNFIFIPKFSYTGAAVTTLMAEAAVFIGSMVVVKKQMGAVFHLKDFRDAAAGCAVMSAFVLSITGFVPPDFVFFRTAVSVLAGAAVYCLTLLLLKNQTVTAMYKKIAAGITHGTKPQKGK